MPLTDSQIVEIMEGYGVSPSPRQCSQIQSYVSLLLRWNRSISLTSVTDELEILKFHFGESVFALSALNSIKGRLADVGVGAGFPGLPLRIFAEGTQLTLIESNAKKAAFLSEVIRELSLDRVRVLRGRFQEVEADLRGNVDVVVSRALGGYNDLLCWSESTLSVNGRIVLWIGEYESREIQKNPEWSWSAPIQIPFSQRRFILAGTPSKNHVD